MINNILFIALVILAITEVIFVVAFFMLATRVKNLKETTDTYKLIMKSDRETIMIIRDAMEKEAETYEHMYELMDISTDHMNLIYEQYQNILKQYGTFYDSFKTINENYKKLLSCWKDVTTASDNASEQFGLCALELKRYADILAPWVIDSDQLGQEYADLASMY